MRSWRHLGAIASLLSTIYRALPVFAVGCLPKRQVAITIAMSDLEPDLQEDIREYGINKKEWLLTFLGRVLKL